MPPHCQCRKFQSGEDRESNSQAANLYFELAKRGHRGIITASDIISQFKQLSVIRNFQDVLRVLTSKTGEYNAGTAVPHNGFRTSIDTLQSVTILLG